MFGFRAHVVLAALVWLALLGGGCFQVAGYDDFTFVEPYRGPLDDSGIDKIDLLFVIDNSRGTKDKHRILADTLAAFLERLLNPRCINVSTLEPVADVGPGEGALCGNGERREFAPVRDLHIGVITSSLGGQGGGLCTEPNSNDRGHLVSRGPTGAPVPTYRDFGFVAWDPEGRKSPPGEDDKTRLVDNLTSILHGVGEDGCGFEATLEAWYRFLVDPEPYDSIAITGGEAVPVGLDEELLIQRNRFLREDSLLAVVMLTDENDCSVDYAGTGYLATQFLVPETTEPYHLPRARAACQDDPSDPCCRSCNQEPGEGCDTSGDDCSPPDPEADPINLRCFDQKRRFGVDFLYPVSRYSDALTARQVPNRVGDPVDNPMLVGRPEGRVVLAGIVGVPWQDIARVNVGGEPDLSAGLDVLGNPVGGVMNSSELLAPRDSFTNTWEIILGDPERGSPRRTR